MKISYVGLRDCSVKLHSSFQNIKEILENVSEVKNEITRSECWCGQASDYYVGKMNNLSKNFDEVFSELEKSALYLDKILEGYEGVDKKVSGSSASMNFGNSNLASTSYRTFN